MLKLLADEDFNNRIVRGLRRRLIALDIVRVQEVGLMEKHDTEVLEWAATEGRVILTHDAATMINFALERVNRGLSMPVIIAVSQGLPVGETIEELLLLSECNFENEWAGQIIFLPLK